VTTVDMNTLLRAMRGGDPDIGREEAFALLAASGFPQRQALLAAVLQDQAESSRTRSAAAIALGRINTRDSQQTLLASLNAPEPGVQAEVLYALGCIGGLDALAAIDALELYDDRRKEAADFASALIAHRLGLEGHELPLPPEDRLLNQSREKSRAIEVTALPAEEGAKVIADLARQPYGVEYDHDRLVRFDCAGRINVWCPNREFTAPGGVARLRERKALAGVVALRSEETGDHSVSYTVMTAPRRESGRLNILAPRCSGRAGLAGTGKVAGDQLEFHLRAVRRPGAFPIELAGEFADQLRLRQATIGLDQVPSRTPTLQR
jgi:hypothetical protein